MGRAAGITLPLLAGDEASISTKTYANTLAALHVAVAALQGDAAVAAAIEDVKAAARALRGGADSGIDAAARVLGDASAITFVGRGSGYVTARQCALTFMEGARRPAAAFSGGAFNHGPIEMLEPGFRLVVIHVDGGARPLTESLAVRARRYGAEVVLLTDVPGASVDGAHVVPVPRLAGSARGEEIFPILACRAQNLLLHHVAAARGHESGVFRHGEKVTTHE